MPKTTIAVVDDHDIVRRGVRALLESRPDYEIVAEAATGREAVELARRQRPDVIVLDLSLPEMNGLDATRQIIRESPGTEVLILTMHHSEELAREVLQAGARGYVLKSDADRNLLPAVDSLRKHQPYLASAVAEVVLGDYLRLTEKSYGHAPPRDPLTAREREVVQLLGEGRTNKEVATVLDVSVKTIESHRANIMRKLRLRSVTDLVRYAIRNKLVEP
jgi:DNA-binding NarL/FixJ family response regulator